MQIFNYAFNLGGDFSIKMEGMSEAMGEFNANISATQKGIGKLTQSLATFNLASDVIEKISGVFNDITKAGANAELQLMNLKTLFGGNAEAAEAMYKRISANFHSILKLTVIKENIPYKHQTFVNKIEQLILLFIVKYLL